MIRKKHGIIFLFLNIIFMLGISAEVVTAENIDPDNDDSQYAYGENVGYLNFEPGGNGGSGAEVTNSAVTGYVWGENIGWINLSPVSYGGVANDGAGNLSGYAWGENVGWINFSPTGGGVTIDSDGVFDGWAWGENIGWIHLKNLAIPYKVKTAWAPPISVTEYTLTVTKAGTGSGTVTSSPAGINCGADCDEAYNEGTAVTLTATPDAGSTFAGWSGDTSDGQVTMNANKACTAEFTATPCQIDASYIRGAIKFGKKGDTARLKIAVGSDFCDALPGDVTVKLSGCDPITIPVAQKGKSSTFLGKTANARLVINCKKHTLTLRLKGIALKDCVANPVKTCISVDGGSCICAEAVFTEKVKKGVLRGLSFP